MTEVFVVCRAGDLICIQGCKNLLSSTCNTVQGYNNFHAIAHTDNKGRIADCRWMQKRFFYPLLVLRQPHHVILDLNTYCGWLRNHKVCITPNIVMTHAIHYLKFAFVGDGDCRDLPVRNVLVQRGDYFYLDIC